MTDKPRKATRISKTATRGERYFRSVSEQYDLSDSELELLEACKRILDEIDELQKSVDLHGVTIQGSTGQTRVHPALSELRQHRLALGRLLAQLQLPNEDGEKLASPAQAKSRQANQVRWSRG